MSDWYTVSFNLRTEETPPTDPWTFIQWLARPKQPIYFDNIQLVKDEAPSTDLAAVHIDIDDLDGDTDG